MTDARTGASVPLTAGFLERLLRHRSELAGELAAPAAARAQLRGALAWSAALGALYGAGMGAFSLFDQGGAWSALASALKVPLLLGCTTLLCFPALYVFGVAGGAGVRATALLAALFTAQAVLTLCLTALLPVALFFMTTTSSYPFVKLMHVAIWSVAGLVALGFLRGLLCQLDPRLGRNRKLLFAWMFLFAVVGGQLAWMLRPFLGVPGYRFQILRPVESNVFENLIHSFGKLLR